MTQALIDDLERRMAQAVADEDFEGAAKLRDELSRLRRHVMIAGDPENPPQASYFKRQVPGRMGLGTDQQVYAPPEGWVPPQKPDPMTKGHTKGGRRKV
jgi:hypothetical protein